MTENADLAYWLAPGAPMVGDVVTVADPASPYTTVFTSGGSGGADLESVDLNTPGGANIGAAASAWILANGPLPGDITIGLYGSPADPYLLVDASNPGQIASWVALVGEITFADPGQVLAGAASGVAIDPAGLQSRILDAPSVTPAADSGHLIELDGGGLIAPGFLPDAYLGDVDVTAAYVANPAAFPGAFSLVAAGGAADASWAAVGVAGAYAAGDLLLWDGAEYLSVATRANLADYVPLAGSAAMSGDLTWTGPQTIDLAQGALVNAVISAGTY